MKTTHKVIVEAKRVFCPYCDAEQGGWFGDPRGVEEECDECFEMYKVDADADVVFDI